MIRLVLWWPVSALAFVLIALVATPSMTKHRACSS